MQYRQGDILFQLVNGPAKGQPVRPQNGRLILALGEATGHHHSIAAQGGALTLDEGGVMYLTLEQLTEVVHQEHGPIPLIPTPSGKVWRVQRQSEYAGPIHRNVTD